VCICVHLWLKKEQWLAMTSTVKRLPQEIRDEIGRLFDAGATLDEVLSHLKRFDLSHCPSRSALGRYRQEIERVGEKVRESRAVAEALVRQLGDQPEGRLARLNIELAHSTVLRLLSGADDDEPVTLDPRDAHFIARSIKDLSAAAKTDADLIIRLRKEVEQKAVATMEKVAKARGLSAETVADLKREFLGVSQ